MYDRLKRIKPRRGWRAFAGEVGIIVLGVLVAVAIGKLVEAYDWHQRVAQAKQVIAEDIRDNGQFRLEERRRVAPCLHRQLARIEQAILMSANDGGFATPVRTEDVLQKTYAHPFRLWTNSLWTSLVADNIPAHMSDRDRQWFEGYYDSLRRMDDWNGEEALLGSELGVLAHRVRLSDDSRVDLLRVVSRLRYRITFMDRGVQQIQASLVERGQPYEIPAREVGDLKVERWCRNNHLL